MKSTDKFNEKNHSSYSIEMKKQGGRVNCVIFGILLVYAYSTEYIELHTHAGRIILKGTGLDLCVFKDGAVEIDGRLESVSLA